MITNQMCSYLENAYETYFLVNACPIFYFFLGGGGVWKVMLKEKGGSAKIKQAIFHTVKLKISRS